MNHQNLKEGVTMQDLSKYVRFWQSIAIDEDDDYEETKARIAEDLHHAWCCWYEQPTPKEWLFKWPDALYAGELANGQFELLECL